MNAVTRSLLVRIAERDDGFPIALHVDDGRENWLNDPVATAQIPGGLPPPPVPTARAATPQEAIRSFLLEEANESDRFEQIGTYLHALLHRGDVAAPWRAAASEAPALQRVLIELPDSLASLPWELLCEGSNWLAADVSKPLVRVGSGFPGEADLRPVRWPLRVLVVVGSQEQDRIVEAEEELQNLDDAFRRMCGQVDVEFLRQPSRDRVTEVFRALRPHIFHFIGHGSVEGGRGRLTLHDPRSGANLPWTVPEIRMDLRGWQPRLAIINACRTSRLDQQEGAWGVADAFAALGVPAVIAMQADIRGDAAAAFTGQLYRSLVAHQPLDVAVTEARRAISQTTGLERRDFALPSLTVSAPPDTVLQMRFGVSEEYRHHVERLHRNFPGFVDRAYERRRLWRELDPEPDEVEEPQPPTEPADAVAIVGPAEVGKSELARWCVGACELHGGNAAYVNLARGSRLDAISLLRLIAEGLEGSAVHGVRNRAAFEGWTMPIAAPPNGNGGAPAPPPANDAFATTFAHFQDALREAAGGQPLLIALDDLGALPDEDLALVCESLLEPIALHRLAPVRVILVLSGDESARLTERLRGAMGSPIRLTSFKPEQFKHIAGQYLRYHFDVPPKVLDEKLAALRPSDEFSWPEVTALAKFVPSYGWSRFT